MVMMFAVFSSVTSVMDTTSLGARCSSVVRAVVLGAMGRRIDP